MYCNEFECVSEPKINDDINSLFPLNAPKISGDLKNVQYNFDHNTEFYDNIFDGKLQMIMIPEKKQKKTKCLILRYER